MIFLMSYLFFRVFYRFLIGFSGSTKKNLESETKTTIKIPSIGSKENNIGTYNNLFINKLIWLHF